MTKTLRALMVGTAAMAAFAAPALAETQTERVVAEARTYLYLNASPEAVSALLPEGWESTPLAEGPAAGANVVLFLVDRQLATDAAGAPLGGMNQLAVFAVPAKGADDAGLVVVGGYAAAGSPGAYGNYEPAGVTLDRSSHTEALVTTSEEAWTVTSEDGDTLSVSLSYEQAAPAVSTFDQRIFSNTIDGFYRMYRGSQVVDVLQSAAQNVDRVETLDVAGTGGLAGDLLGSSEVVAVSRFALYQRDTFVP